MAQSDLDFENICVLICCSGGHPSDGSVIPLFTVPLSLLKKAIDDDFGGRSSMSLRKLPEIWKKEPEVSKYESSSYHLFVLVPNRRAVVDRVTDYDLFLSIGKNWTNYKSWEDLKRCIIEVAMAKMSQQSLF